MAAGDPNSDAHSSAAGNWPTEPSSQPTVVFIKKIKCWIQVSCDQAEMQLDLDFEAIPVIIKVQFHPCSQPTGQPGSIIGQSHSTVYTVFYFGGTTLSLCQINIKLGMN